MSDVTDIIPPTVPASTVEFAKAVAELAKQHRIEGFTMEMRPSYGYSSKVPKPRNQENYGAELKGFDGFRSHCRPCVLESKKSHYHRTRPAQRARQLAYQQANRPKLYAYNAEWQRKRHVRLRAEAIAAYGGKCACCGEAEPIFLDIDHIHNDGSEHRRVVGNSDRLMLELRSSGWPRDRVQLLCCNCNQGKVRNGGVCPHAR